MATLHLQQQILYAVKTVLETGATGAGSHVYLERVDPLPKALLPALLVEEADAGETVQDETIHGLEVREFLVQIDCVVQQNDGYGAAARALGLQVEKLLAAPGVFAALCGGGVRILGGLLLRDGGGEKALASRRQTWRFTYYCDSETPDIAGLTN